jgi:hypothetical protein
MLDAYATKQSTTSSRHAVAKAAAEYGLVDKNLMNNMARIKHAVNYKIIP